MRLPKGVERVRARGRTYYYWNPGRGTDRESERIPLPNADDRPLADIAKRCGFGGMSQFSRAFRARFGAPPRQYLALIRQQDLDWHEARLMADGFEQDAFLWRQQGLNGSKPPSGPG